MADGSKTFEVRVNDRGFQKGDHVLLREFDPRIVTVVGDFGHSYEEERGFTGAKDLEFKIGYVLPLDAERVAFSLVKETHEQA